MFMRIKEEAERCAFKCNRFALLVVALLSELLCYKHTNICTHLEYNIKIPCKD